MQSETCFRQNVLQKKIVDKLGCAPGTYVIEFIHDICHPQDKLERKQKKTSKMQQGKRKYTQNV